MVISGQGAEYDTSKLALFEDFIPTTKKHIMKLHGFINYFRPSIVNSATKIKFYPTNCKRTPL